MDEQPSKRPLQSPEEKPQSSGRPPARWKDMAEEVIEEAIRSGAFDDLPGRGKPLKLHNNPYAPGTELAYQLLRDNQYTLPWISERASVLARIESLRDELSQSWTGYYGEYQALSDDSHRLTLAQEWQQLLVLWAELIVDLNQEIATLNLKQPAGQLEIMKLSLTAELARADARPNLG
jgi:DnaJ family protein C protein 28